MQFFDPRSEENWVQKSMGETAVKVVELANHICEPVVVIWGEDEIFVYPDAEVEGVLITLEISAYDQQNVAMRNKE